MADRKIAYASSVSLTTAGLGGLASSADFTAGWESDAIDNTSNLYLDYRLAIAVQSGLSGVAAGELRVYLVGPLSDSSWPDVFDGTRSTETVTDTEVRDAICRLAASTQMDTTANQDYFLEVPSVAAVFDGNLPKKFVIFITHNTSAALGSGTQLVYHTGSYETH